MLRLCLRDLMLDDGRAMTVRSQTLGTYDPDTGTLTASTDSDYTGVGRLGNYHDAVINGTMIKAGDRRCTIVFDNQAFVPKVGDRLLVGTDTYAVVNVKERELGGTVIGFTLQVRSGG